MNTYKITNITNLAGKRDINFNKVVDITYLDNRIKKVSKLKAGDNMFLSIASLPLSVHRLRIKGLISISEVSPAELAKTMKASKPKPKPKKKAVSTAVKEKATTPKKTTTRKTTKKTAVKKEASE